MLKMLDERTARLDQERACGEKATNHDELKKYRPQPPMGGADTSRPRTAAAFADRRGRRAEAAGS